MVRGSLWIGVCLLGACGPVVPVDAESPSGTSDGGGRAGGGGRPGRPGPGSGNRPGSASDVTTAGDPGSGDVDTGFFPDWGTVGASCTLSPEFACSNGVDCNLAEPPCGDAFSPFDDEGCLRTSCPCAANEVCFAPADFGGCASSDLSCSDAAGDGCVCGGSDDCGGSYCLPADEVPALPCVGFTDPGSCARANCAWFDGGRVHADSECVCDEMSGICVPPLEYELGPGPIAYYPLVPPQDAVQLPFSLEPVPMGVQPCDGVDDPAACACLLALEWNCP